MKVAVEIPIARIQDLLCCALEGGSNYWYMIRKFEKPDILAYRIDATTIYEHLDYPVNNGGALLIEKDEGTAKRLDLASIESGLAIMAEKYPDHFSDFMQENEDGTTGDVFLQCCLFGKVVYA